MRSMTATLLFSVSALGLSACATTGLGNINPEATSPSVEIPAAPQNADTGQVDWVEPAPDRLPSTDWVADFNDPVLLNLIQEAMRANTDVRLAAARLAAAEAGAKSSRSGLYPRIGASSNASRTEIAEDNIPSRSSFGLGGSVSWEVDMWGRIRDTANAGDIEAEASNADYAGTRLAIAGLTAQTWFNLTEARLLTDLAERNVQTQERALRLTKRRFDGGVSGSSDFRLARSALANAEATLALRRQNESSTARSLETILRRYPADALQAQNELPPLPPLTGAGSPGEIFLRRPDLLAAERRMQAAGLRVDISQKNLLPRLTLDGGVNSNGGSIQRLFSLDNLIASIAGGLTAPLFEGGALRAEVARNEAVLNQQLESYADTALTAYREVEDALDAEDRLREREDALEIALEEAQKAEERLELRFSEGLASILQLLDAQSRRISSEGQLISARKERLANRVRLHLALGGGVYGEELAREKLPKPRLAGL
ncbi:MAG: efflux transporter outer membrane subunit [Acidimicrobiales bacterium]|nr:efflux transporter outer membrane subunit [Hyphomonadaceae bacterium]RZV44010.1 MAG: efflux transporter outer membrane subunit [Acidimicrobiales bacterium]